MRTTLSIAGALLAVWGGVAARAVQPQSPEAAHEYFERNVRPLLVARCHDCHAEGRRSKGGLDLTSRAGLLAGGGGGAVVDLDAPAKSRLLAAVRREGELKMPPDEPLAPDEIRVLETWLAGGAAWPGGPATEVADDDRGAPHWSFQPPVEPAVPEVRDRSWPSCDIDRFILAALEARDLAPSPDADREALLRRVSFDLVGLPPTPEERAAFLADPSEQAYERVIDRLLASPRYGERWARHWLDVVRYAESNGQESDLDKPHAHQFRDFVIQAFNADLPFDQFVQAQVAGDLLEADGRSAPATSVPLAVASAFHWLGELQPRGVDPPLAQAMEIENQIDTIGKAFLGLTLACARCHDHKFDPVTARDYYALAGILESTTNVEVCIDPPDVAAQLAELRGELSEIDGQLESLLAPARRAQRIAAAGELARYLSEACRLFAARRKQEGRLDPAAIQEAAARGGLDQARLARWLDELDDSFDKLSSLWQPIARIALADPEQFRAYALANYWGLIDAEVPPSAEVPQTVFDEFDGDRFDPEIWTPIGTAFGPGPQPVEADETWRCAAASYGGSDRLEGVLTSRRFKIEHRFLNAWIAGGTDPQRTCLRVLSHSAALPEGTDLSAVGDGTERFVLRSIDLQLYLGREGLIEIVDAATEEGGHVAVDRITFSDELPQPPPRGPNLLLVDQLWRPEIQSLETLLARYQSVVVDVLRKWQAALPAEPPATPDCGPSVAPEGDDDQRQIVLWAMADDSPLAGALDEVLGFLEPHQRDEAHRLIARQRALEAQLPDSQMAIVSCDDAPHDAHLQERGNPAAAGEVVPRGVGQLLGLPLAEPCRGSGRRKLAAWIASSANPLTARVIVNRVWEHHFGRGLVPTPNNFGTMGEPPSHPELLDYLALRFVGSGWSLKRLHRELLLSRTYRQTSDVDPAKREADPANRWLSRMALRRLDAEALRDAMLAVAGNLNLAMGGPGVKLYISPYMSPGPDLPLSSGPMDGDGRRSIYLEIRRNRLPSILETFGLPRPTFSEAIRDADPLPAQALALLNNEFVGRQAELWARRVCARVKDTDARIEAMIIEAMGRAPHEGEIALCREFVAEHERLVAQAMPDEPDPRERAWANFAHSLFNAAEFYFVR